MADPNILEEFEPPEGRVYLALGTRQKSARDGKSFVGESFDLYAFSYGITEQNYGCSSCPPPTKYFNGDIYKIVAASSSPSLFLERLVPASPLYDRLVDWALLLMNDSHASGWRTFDQVVALIWGHWSNDDISNSNP